jgi:hypothetical protein
VSRGKSRQRQNQKAIQPFLTPPPKNSKLVCGISKVLHLFGFTDDSLPLKSKTGFN